MMLSIIVKCLSFFNTFNLPSALVLNLSYISFPKNTQLVNFGNSFTFSNSDQFLILLCAINNTFKFLQCGDNPSNLSILLYEIHNSSRFYPTSSSPYIFLI